MRIPDRLKLLFLALAGAALIAPAAGAQNYPTKPVRIVVANTPGGPTDVIARLMAGKLSQIWGQPVVVDNRAGAGGVIGTDFAAKSAPDGYTFILVSTPHFTNPALHTKLPYDSLKDFAPVTGVTSVPAILVANSKLPVASVADVVALAKAKPGELRAASAGNGTGPHLAAALFQSMAGIELQHIPYKGAGPATVAIISGEVELFFASPASAVSQIKAGKFKGLAITSAERSPIAPDLPTVVESGLAGFVFSNWNCLLAPAGTPAAIIAKVNSDVREMLAMPDIKERLAGIMFDPAPSSPDELGSLMAQEIARWGKIIREAGIQAD